MSVNGLLFHGKETLEAKHARRNIQDFLGFNCFHFFQPVEGRLKIEQMSNYLPFHINKMVCFVDCFFVIGQDSIVY